MFGSSVLKNCWSPMMQQTGQFEQRRLWAAIVPKLNNHFYTYQNDLYIKRNA